MVRRHGIWVGLAAVAVACGGAVETETGASCDAASEPACGSEAPLCVDGVWTCDGCNPSGAGAADCWDPCHGMHAPHCENGVWACLDPDVGGCSATGGSGGVGGEGGYGASGGVGGVGGSPSCAALSEAIAEETSIVGACVTVVRLRYATFEILGFEIFCGSYGSLDEATARSIAQADTGYGDTGQLLSGAFPDDEWVFWEPAGDFGGTGVVSSMNGLTVFGGSTIWSGAGDITYPTAWRPAAELGPDCIPLVNALPPEARGFNLDTGQALGSTEVEAAMDQAWLTALPDALWGGSYVFPSMVLLYARTTGAFDPSTAEWIVLMNSGWLE